MPGRKHKFNKQHIVLAALLIISLVLYSVRMLDLQVINAEIYSEQGSGTFKRTAVIKAARGEILDRYGRQLAVNRNGYDIVFNSAYIDRSELNGIIERLTDLLAEYNTEWVDALPLAKTSPFGFIGEEADKKTLLRTLDLAHYATAENCFSQLCERYSLEGMDEARQRRIMGVRYTMEIADFSIAHPFTLASDISEKLMQRVSESAFMLDGITVNVVPVREYVDGTLASNFLGTVGSMSASDWEKLKDKGYSYSDKIGITGVEAAYEEELHGTDGEITYTLDGDGNTISTKITRKPVPGNTVMLSIDKKLQSESQNTLKSLITELNSKGGTASGGAAVALDIKSGEVLLAATYPGFDINDYFDKYSELASQKNNPLTNRAFAGIYPPGSSLKPVIGIAALQTGKLGATETIRCTHTYRYYASSGFTPKCMGTHGSINIVRALSKSCNYFFYEVGRRLGIETINSYLKQFGFGSKTGVEVYESEGLLDTDTEGWFAGNTLQVSIGQHNAFTPIQICSATATIANGGTRYKTTLVDKIVSYDLSKTYYSNTPTALNTVKIDKSVLDLVKSGMLSVTEDGTGSSVFRDYPIKVGGKTGTSQTDSGADNNIFVAFAPFDNPEIAVAVVIEHGASSYTSGSVMRAVMDSYFFNNEEHYSESRVNLPLK